MMQPTLEELERQADEIMSKAEKNEKLDPEDVSEEAAEDSDEEEEEPEETDADTEDDADDDDADEVNKSLIGETIDEDEDEEIPGTVSAIVEVFAKSLADVVDNIAESKETADGTSTILAKSLLAQNVLLRDLKTGVDKANRETAKLRKSLAALDAKLDNFGVQPAHMRKSVASYSVTDRNFKGSLEGTERQAEPLSKAEITAILNNELMNGSSVVLPSDVVGVESGSPLREEIRALIDSKRTR